LETGV